MLCPEWEPGVDAGPGWSHRRRSKVWKTARRARQRTLVRWFAVAGAAERDEAPFSFFSSSLHGSFS